MSLFDRVDRYLMASMSRTLALIGISYIFAIFGLIFGSAMVFWIGTIGHIILGSAIYTRFFCITVPDMIKMFRNK